MTFPLTRLRRGRRTPAMRALMQENRLCVEDLIYPLFVQPGEGLKTPIPSLPELFQYSVDTLIMEVQEAASLGIQAIALFPVVDNSQRSALATEAYNPQGLIQVALRALKQACPDITLISDVALDPFTLHGHDGISEADNPSCVDNDATLDLLVKQALSHAAAGADIVAPSDMMDGRIGVIRQALEKGGFIHTGILAYSAKYASSLYGPFRQAIGSQGTLIGDKRHYQMDPANAEEAIHEAGLDLDEGADWILVKPGLPYLDIVRRLKDRFHKPTVSYMVSGEYAMIQQALSQGMMPLDGLLELHLCCKRAGADAIISYFAKKIALLLQNA